MRPYCVLMLTTGFTVTKRGNEDDIIEGIIDVIGHGVPIVGSSSGDDFNLKKTYTFCNGKIYDNSVVCAVISSNLKIGYQVKHGYIPTEKSMFVNKAKDYIIHELDKKIAFDRYSEVLGKKKEEIWPTSMKLQQLGPISSAFMSFAKKLGVDVMKLSPIIEINCNMPLALCEYKPYLKGRFWIKGLDSVIDNKYLRFTEKVPQGTALYLMKTSKERSLKAVQESVKEGLKTVEKNASFALVFDCALHRWFLGKYAKRSVNLMKNTLKDVPFIGMYSYGEILDGKHTLSVVSMIVGQKLAVSKG
ncbi:MAG: FIST N-terminal domain-containing protein [Candidatus Aenigmarchaeota archaeon]|nr:FIST N-terminal domain-containing protein [Candidatus Aenigmarchaeota archaeon]